MTKTRENLKKLKTQCEQLCEEEGWLGPESKSPNFRLIYTSVETFEHSNNYAIIGINPAGHLRHADSDNNRETPFYKKGYSAYLDDDWEAGCGQSRFQRAVQGIAMILTGSTPSQAMKAIRKDNDRKPERRIGAAATEFLRETPSLNIIPFRSPRPECLPPKLLECGPQIGWELLSSIKPKPRYIITLANALNGYPWSTLRKMGGQQLPHEEKINERNDRKYREVKLIRVARKPLVFGLPAVVYDKVQEGERGITKPMFKVLRRRLLRHDII